MPTLTKTSTEDAKKYLGQLGYTSPDAGEIAGAQSELDPLVDQVNGMTNTVDGLMANSLFSRNISGANSLKLDGAIGRVATNYGAKDRTTGEARNDINDPNAQAGAGFKFAYQPDGTKVQIPQGSTPEQYGMSNNPPTPTAGTTGAPAAGTAGTTGTAPATDPYTKALSDYNATIATQAAETKQFYDDFATRQDETTQALIGSIQKKYEARRLKMEDINKRYLEGKRVAGISAGRQRYATSIEEGLLSAEEMDGQARLAEIDAEELSLIAQAKQARTEADFKTFNDKMDRLEQNNKSKLDIITKLHDASIAADKALEDKRKTAFSESNTLFEQGLKKADAYAASAFEAMKTLGTEEDKAAYLEKLAKDNGIDAEMLKSSIAEYAGKEETRTSQITAREAATTAREQSLAIQEQRLALQAERQAKGTISEKKANVFSGINTLIDPNNQELVKKQFGIAFMDENGYITPQGFKALVKNAAEENISRKEFLAEYGAQLYLQEGKSKEYGLTAQEAKTLSSGDGNIQFINKAWLDDAGYHAEMSKIEAWRKAGYTDKDIVKLLEKE